MTIAQDLGGTHPLTLRREFGHIAPGLIAHGAAERAPVANLGSIDIADPGQDQLLAVPTLLLLVWILEAAKESPSPLLAWSIG